MGRLYLYDAEFRTDPYLIGMAKNVFPPGLYSALVASYPSEVIFASMGSGGSKFYNKFSLSERNNPELYHQFLSQQPTWKRLHAYIKSKEFIHETLTVLRDTYKVYSAPPGDYTSRFEFSSLSAVGGGIAPHTDTPSKVVTLVVSLAPYGGSWDEEWGGGTDVLKPKDPNKPLKDYKAGPEEFDVVHTYEYGPNQAVIFIKTDNSWHQVRPCRGKSPGIMRRTLTINIEHAK